MDAKLNYDVFLSHNSSDNGTAEDIARRLKERGLRVWLDLWEIPVGASFQEAMEQGLRHSSSVAILFGAEEVRPWTSVELQVSSDLGAKGEMKVIPVLLPGHPPQHRVPLLLQIYSWVDMRDGITDEALDRLMWGITGRPPATLATDVLPGSFAVSSSLSQAGRPTGIGQENLDAMAVAAVKRKLHISSEIVARGAASSAAMAARVFPSDMLTIIVPLYVDLRWSRGYASALKRLLKPPEATRRVGDFSCAEPVPPCSRDNGLLSARRDGPDRVTVCIQDEPACIVDGMSEGDASALENAVNRYGRLGAPAQGGMSAFQRVREVGVALEASGETDDLAGLLYRQRDVLIPLLARWGIPGDHSLLVQEEAYPAPPRSPSGAGEGVAAGRSGKKRAGAVTGKPSDRRQIPTDTQNAEEIPSRGAWTPPAAPSLPDLDALQRLLKRFEQDTGR